jgi:pyruvate-ferredoxin/flavodoxin oxidoreductase
VSHLRFGPDPIRSTYLIENAHFVASHQFGLLDRLNVLDSARDGATVLINAPYPVDEVWGHLPQEVQEQIIRKSLEVWVVDATRIAKEVGLGGRINTVMQPCFFTLAGVLDRDEAVRLIKLSIEKSYKRRGRTVVERNHAAVDRALLELHHLPRPESADSGTRMLPAVAVGAPDFVRDVTARMLAGQGDLLPVSALPVDGTFPTGTARWEKRGLADAIPVWDASLCIDCGKCAIVCPHAAIRIKAFPESDLKGAPLGFVSKPYGGKDLGTGMRLTVKVAPDDCTGCGICVDVCPARSKSRSSTRRSTSCRPPTTVTSSVRGRLLPGNPEIPRAAVRQDTVKARSSCSRSSSSPERVRGAGRLPT